MKIHFRAVTFIAAIVCILPQLSLAQTQSSSEEDTQTATSEPTVAGFSTLDFSIPESPAFTVLGIAPGNVTAPINPRSFAASLLNGIDPQGNLQSGLAVDVVPYILVRGADFTLAEYRDPSSVFKRFLANTQISIGTTKGTSAGDESVRLALGFYTVLLNQGDLRMDDQFVNELGQIYGELPVPDASSEELEAFAQRTEAQVRDARANARSRLAQKPIWIAAFSPSLISSTGQYDSLRWNGIGFWTSYSQGLGGDSQLIAHLRYRTNEQVVDDEVPDTFFSQNSLLAGLRIRMGNPDLRYSFETSYINRSLNGGLTDNLIALGFGLEPRLEEDLWLALSFTAETGFRDSGNIRFQSGLKWAFNDQ